MSKPDEPPPKGIKTVKRMQRFICCVCGHKEVLVEENIPAYLRDVTTATPPADWGIHSTSIQVQDGTIITSSKPVCPSCTRRAKSA